jgi:sugar lactone lactonase YvrE
MKRLRRIMGCVVLSVALVGATVAGAASPSKGLKGSEGEILSRVTTLAGSGTFDYQDGDALSASFRTPQGMVVLADGSVLVSDSRNQLIRKIDQGEVTTFAGITLESNELGLPLGGWSDGVKETAVFDAPSGLTVDAEGNIYVADTGNHVIRKIDTEGNVTTVAGDGVQGNQNGTGEGAQFYHPQDVAVAKDGTLYIADTLNHSIRKIAPDGKVTTLNAASERSVEVVAGSVESAGDYVDGSLRNAKFNEPSGIVIDSKGNLYVSDTGNQLIRYIDLLRGQVTTVAGTRNNTSSFYEENRLYAEGGFVDGKALEAKFYYPKGIALTDEGGLLIADSLNHSIRYLVDGEVTTLAGDPNGGYGNSNGINGYNQLHYPTDIALMSDGSILIADSYNHLIKQVQLYQLPSEVVQDDQLKVVLDSEIITFDEAPELANGRTMVPVRAVSEALGYVVEFENNDQTIKLTKGNITVALYVGHPEISIDTGDNVMDKKDLDSAPYIKNGRTYVPLRFISEEFGLDVQWNSSSKTVILREKG